MAPASRWPGRRPGARFPCAQAAILEPSGGQRPLGWRLWQPARPAPAARVTGDVGCGSSYSQSGRWGVCKVRSQGTRRKRALWPWLNRSGGRLRAWLRFSDAGPGPPPARLGGAEPAPGSRREEAAEFCLTRHRQSWSRLSGQGKAEGTRPKTVMKAENNGMQTCGLAGPGVSRGHGTAYLAQTRKARPCRRRPGTKQCSNPALMTSRGLDQGFWGH